MSAFERIRRAGGLFVAGTDTEVGKTVAAACLTRALDGDYWKPVQSGLDGETDPQAVRRLLALEDGRLHPCAYEFKEPLSPHEAARREGRTIRMEAFIRPKTERPLVVEGAGGLLVPLNGENTMIDLIDLLGLPVVLVARSSLGTINHTLLSLEALANRRLEVLGVIMNGPPNPANAQAVNFYGSAPVLYQLEFLEPLDDKAVAGAARHLSAALRGEDG